MTTPTTSTSTTRAGAGVPPEAARRAMTRCAPAPLQTRPRTPRCGHRDGGVHGSFAVAGRAEPAPPIAPATGPSAVQVLSAPSISVLPPEALRAIRDRPGVVGVGVELTSRRLREADGGRPAGRSPDGGAVTGPAT